MRHEQPRRGAGQAERDGAVGNRRLLRHAGLEVRVRALQALCGGTRDRFDLALQRLVHVQADAERTRDQLHRAVVVRRAEAARDEAGVGGQRLPQRRFELLGAVPDDRDPRGLEAEPERLAGEERAVEVGSLAAHELAPRGDDEGARLAQPPARAVSDGVTTTFRFRRAGSDTGFPASVTRTAAGRFT